VRCRRRWAICAGVYSPSMVPEREPSSPAAGPAVTDPTDAATDAATDAPTDAPPDAPPDAPIDAEIVAAPAAPPAPRTEPDEPPVVVRMVVEIRSDGRRTIARGAMEDKLTGKAVAINARGDSPLSLALSLSRSLLAIPAVARAAARALLPGKRRRGD
jgi:hypothetical protein